MDYIKRIFTSSLIVLFICVAFMCSFAKGYYSYAEDIHYMSDTELEAAYQAYLQSKGGGLLGNAGARLAYTNGKMLNFLTSDSNTTPYKNINDIKGLMSWQKKELESGNSSVLQLSMSPGGASVFSLYTQWLLQNHYFGNGASENNNGMFNDGVDDNLYDGYLYTNYNGESCLVYIFNNISSGSATDYTHDNSDILEKGTRFLYASSTLVNMYDGGTSSFQVYLTDSISFEQPLYKNGTSTKGYVYNFVNGTMYGMFSGSYNNVSYSGNMIIFKLKPEESGLRYGFLSYNSNGKFSVASSRSISQNKLDNNNFNDVDINFYTNNNNNINLYPSYNDIDANGSLNITPKVNVGVSPEINYQPYYINEGDTINNVVNNYYQDSGDKDKTITVPDTGNPSGGGGDDNPDNPSGPSGGTPPNWDNPYPSITQDSDGVFNFNFHLPDLNIDWNISGLKEKFPFSIPFDLISFVQVLDAEPETPEFTGTINLIVYQWELNADLHQFDNLAGIVRNVEFIGFCITLIMITRKMIKG